MNGKLQNPITIKPGVRPAVRKGRRTKGNRLYEVVANRLHEEEKKYPHTSLLVTLSRKMATMSRHCLAK